MLVVQYMMGHCCLGSFVIPYEDALDDCPLYRELYLEDHFVFDCTALRDMRDRWLDIRNRGIGDLIGLVCSIALGWGPLFVRCESIL